MLKHSELILGALREKTGEKTRTERESAADMPMAQNPRRLHYIRKRVPKFSGGWYTFGGPFTQNFREEKEKKAADNLLSSSSSRWTPLLELQA
ncbi:hypothetical protein GQ457_16G017770 [Hibiscus cannabinus]